MIRRKSLLLLLTLAAFIASGSALEAAKVRPEGKAAKAAKAEGKKKQKGKKEKAAESKPAATKPAATRPASHPVVELGEAVVAPGPQAGEVYKVFTWDATGQRQYRVTDPNVNNEEAWKFLPNSPMKIQIADLKDAVRAEVVLDRWGGHTGTMDESIQFNGGNWLALPDVQGVTENPSQYMSQDNPVIEVPLDQLKEGENSVVGYCREAKGWGQFGIFAMVVRVYYDPAKKAHTKAEIAAPANGAELTSPATIEVKATEGEIQKVEVLAEYEDYDFDGDGVYKEYVGAYHQVNYETPIALAHHVGTADAAPFNVTWDMQWVPDQAEAISLIARVQSADGVWFVTEPVTGLTIGEREQSVQLYKASDVPTRFGARTNKTLTCKIVIPEGTDLSKAVDAKLYLRTWNGTNEEHGDFLFNDLTVKGKGANHHYAFSEHEIPVENLKVGENVVSFTSPTKHHHLEVSWPGPGLVVRYKK